MKIIDHNVETGEVVEREMTKAEIDQITKNQLQSQSQAEQKAAKKSALLDRLGITADEAALLLS